MDHYSYASPYDQRVGNNPFLHSSTSVMDDSHLQHPNSSVELGPYTTSYEKLNDQQGYGAGRTAATAGAAGGAAYYHAVAPQASTVPAKKGFSKTVIGGIVIAALLVLGTAIGVGVGVSLHKTSTTNGNSSPSISSSSSGPGINGTVNSPPVANIPQCTVPSNSGGQLRKVHPRLIGNPERFACIKAQAAVDTRMQPWFKNITDQANALIANKTQPPSYTLDGGNGVLDACRSTQLRMKFFGMAYQFTNDTKYPQAAWSFIDTIINQWTDWNPTHFLDTAECAFATAIAYDWMYSAWSADQLSQMRDAIVTRGLQPGLNQLSSVANGFWIAVEGNWNCVCNNGIFQAAVAILDEDTTGNANKVIAASVQNFAGNCMQAFQADGSWPESPNYFEFGSTAAIEMLDTLDTAYSNTSLIEQFTSTLSRAAYFRMFIGSPIPGQLTSIAAFNYGDWGPPKIVASTNFLFYLANKLNIPVASTFLQTFNLPVFGDPTALLWFNATQQIPKDVSGLDLDRAFNVTSQQVFTMRSSWTDANQGFVGFKGGDLTSHQNHNDLDIGTFVYDVLGVRWAEELGHENYNNVGFFSGSTQNAQRWYYYRKNTEGQNTLMIGSPPGNSGAEMVLTAAPTIVNYWGPNPVNNQDPFVVLSTTSAYDNAKSATRGIRFVHSRKEVVLQDEFAVNGAGVGPVYWFMHTTASISIAQNGQSATLSKNGKTLTVTIASPVPAGATFKQMPATRLSGEATFSGESPDDPNQGITKLAIEFSNPSTDVTTLSVVLTPGYGNGYVPWTQKVVPLAQWSLTSHQ